MFTTSDMQMIQSVHHRGAYIPQWVMETTYILLTVFAAVPPDMITYTHLAVLTWAVVLHNRWPGLEPSW